MNRFKLRFLKQESLGTKKNTIFAPRLKKLKIINVLSLK